jgi:hypothetical protein
MTIHPLPPQAYTKDTLIKAYEWLQAQDEGIKKIATSPDVLVSLYMKAQMQGEEALHRPSIKNFKSDLKNLASIMGEWDATQAQAQPQSVTGLASPSISSSKIVSSANPSSATRVQLNYKETPVSNSSVKTSDSVVWGEGLQIKLKEIQDLYHLSSELETARLLISIGYHHAKRLMS